MPCKKRGPPKDRIVTIEQHPASTKNNPPCLAPSPPPRSARETEREKEWDGREQQGRGDGGHTLTPDRDRDRDRAVGRGQASSWVLSWPTPGLEKGKPRTR